MLATNNRIEQLRDFFKSHSKCYTLKAHSSKVSKHNLKNFYILFIFNLQVHSVGWNCDGRKLASGSFDKSVAVYTLDRDRLVKFYLNLKKIIFIHF